MTWGALPSTNMLKPKSLPRVRSSAAASFSCRALFTSVVSLRKAASWASMLSVAGWAPRTTRARSRAGIIVGVLRLLGVDGEEQRLGVRDVDLVPHLDLLEALRIAHLEAQRVAGRCLHRDGRGLLVDGLHLDLDVHLLGDGGARLFARPWGHAGVQGRLGLGLSGGQDAHRHRLDIA